MATKIINNKNKESCMTSWRTKTLNNKYQPTIKQAKFQQFTNQKFR